MTAPKSRIGDKHGMIARLGPAHWASFLEHANMHHKAAFLALFTESDRLVCSGPLEGGHCPRDFGLSMTELGTWRGLTSHVGTNGNRRKMSSPPETITSGTTRYSSQR